MQTKPKLCAAALLLTAATITAPAATRYVDLNSANPTSTCTLSFTGARKIQHVADIAVIITNPQTL